MFSAAEAMLCTAPHTMDDLESGLQKIAEKAAFYDASRHNGLAAFEGSHMTLLTFRDQMRNNLGIEFTPGELAALLERYAPGILIAVEGLRVRV